MIESPHIEDGPKVGRPASDNPRRAVAARVPEAVKNYIAEEAVKQGVKESAIVEAALRVGIPGAPW